MTLDWKYFKLYHDGNHVPVVKKIEEFIEDNRNSIPNYFVFFYSEPYNFFGKEKMMYAIGKKFKDGDIAYYIRFRFAPIGRIDENHWKDKIVDKFWNESKVIAIERYDYDLQADLGQRFYVNGDVKKMEAVLKYLEACADLNFAFGKSPINHDIIHLYFNSLNLGYDVEESIYAHRILKIINFRQRVLMQSAKMRTEESKGGIPK